MKIGGNARAATAINFQNGNNSNPSKTYTSNDAKKYISLLSERVEKDFL